MQAFSESVRSALRSLPGSMPACSRLNEGQPPGWPARVPRTVGRGCHPKGRSVAQDPRSGLTVVVDRARGGRAPSEGLRGSVHTVRCCRVSGLIDCGTATAAGPYGDTRVESKSSECVKLTCRAPNCKGDLVKGSRQTNSIEVAVVSQYRHNGLSCSRLAVSPHRQTVFVGFSGATCSEV